MSISSENSRNLLRLHEQQSNRIAIQSAAISSEIFNVAEEEEEKKKSFFLPEDLRGTDSAGEATAGLKFQQAPRSSKNFSRRTSSRGVVVIIALWKGLKQRKRLVDASAYRSSLSLSLSSSHSTSPKTIKMAEGACTSESSPARCPCPDFLLAAVLGSALVAFSREKALRIEVGLVEISSPFLRSVRFFALAFELNSGLVCLFCFCFGSCEVCLGLGSVDSRALRLSL